MVSCIKDINVCVCACVALAHLSVHLSMSLSITYLLQILVCDFCLNMVSSFKDINVCVCVCRGRGVALAQLFDVDKDKGGQAWTWAQA